MRLRPIIFLMLLLTLGTATRADEGRLYSSDRLTSTSINCITQDQHGFVWIGTQQGLNRFDGYRFTPYYYKPGNRRTISHNNVSVVYVSSKGTLWVGTAKGLMCYNEKNDDFKRIDLLPKTDDQPRIAGITEAPDGRVIVGTSGYGLFELKDTIAPPRSLTAFGHGSGSGHYPAVHVDKFGRFWKIGIDNTVYCYSSVVEGKSKLIFSYNLTAYRPYRFAEAKKGTVVVICDKGGAVFRKGMTKPQILEMPFSTITCASFDHDCNMLVGTSGNGMFSYDYKKRKLSRINVNNRDVAFSSTFVSDVFEDRQHNLWIGCDRRGLLFKSRQGQLFHDWSIQSQGYKSGGVLSSAILNSEGNGVWCCVGDGQLFEFDGTGNILRAIRMPGGISILHRDAQGRMWFTVGNNLYLFDETRETYRLVHTFEGTFISSLIDDGRGNLYIGDFSRGVTVYDTNTGATLNYNMKQNRGAKGNLCNDWVMDMVCDSKGLVWVGTSAGLSCLDPNSQSFRHFGWNHQLEAYSVVSLAEAFDGSVMVGTDRGIFRFDRNKNTLLPFPTQDNMPDKDIRSIMCEQNGDLWCSTSMGIWHYRNSDRQLIGHISDNGLREREYTKNLALRFSDGRLLFGNSDGLVVFDPRVIHSPKKPGTIILTNLFIGDERVNGQTLSNGDVITDRSVPLSQSISLSYLDNSFVMEFTTFNYTDARNIIFEYKLNDDRWMRNAAGDNRISFNHLQPGTYKLYVRVAENGDKAKPSVFTITIRAPWYRTTLAYLIYIIVALLLAGYAIWRYLQGKQQRLAEEKMQFLINATHDIRTPLTLVLNPLHQLMNRTYNEDDFKAKLCIIEHNARRILTLVNQILDIRKIDKMQMKLRCQETPLASFVKGVCTSFELYARERDIKFLIPKSGDITVFIDRVQFDKVIQNLLSNAFKFTADGGTITVGIECANGKACISVTDTGTGLRESEIPKLFKRFYQSTVNLVAGKEGTGIGLNLCKMIVEMHHGTIEAHNRTDGQKGSVFTVTLPLGSSHLAPEELMADDESAVIPRQQVKPKTKYRILLVDDDKEMTDYISTELSGSYHFHSCSNGKEALQELLSADKTYDLVVSDIMMPEMDGFMLLRTIKSNSQLSHLPVILLTSEAAVANRLEGLHKGADAFLAKPFIMEELQATINNLIARAQNLERKFSGTEQERKEKVEQRDIADIDKQLMDRVMQSVNRNLSDSDFSVEQLAEDAGLSRSQLHRKMKELTGMSPSDFVRNLRLEQAARLLRERRVNVSQVAYSLGFNSLGNFSKSFKHHFGLSPSEYAANNE